jgi:hypothetical protein
MEHLTRCRPYHARTSTKKDVDLEQWALREGVIGKTADGVFGLLCRSSASRSRQLFTRPMTVTPATSETPATRTAGTPQNIEDDDHTNQLLCRFVWICVSCCGFFSSEPVTSA